MRRRGSGDGGVEVTVWCRRHGETYRDWVARIGVPTGQIGRPKLRSVRTQADVARQMGISRARIQQIEKQALAKLWRGLDEWRGHVSQERCWAVP